MGKWRQVERLKMKSIDAVPELSGQLHEARKRRLVVGSFKRGYEVPFRRLVESDLYTSISDEDGKLGDQVASIGEMSTLCAGKQLDGFDDLLSLLAVEATFVEDALRFCAGDLDVRAEHPVGAASD